MISKAKFSFLIVCILAAAGILAVFKFHAGHPSPASHPSPTSANAGTTAPAVATGHELPETPLPEAYFKLTIKSDTDTETSDQHQKAGTELELKYAHQKTNDGIVLVFYMMEVKNYQDGEPAGDTLMARDKFVSVTGTQKTETAFDDLPSQWRTGIAASFATGLCKVTLDADQNELGRQMFPSGGGYGVIGQDNLNLVRLMHGPYHRGADRWQSTNDILTGYPLVIHCPVEYAKVVGTNNDINVKGSFAKDQINLPAEDAVFKNVSCSLTGTESFDATVGEYTSGDVTVQCKFQIFQGDVQVAAVDKALKLSLIRVTTPNQ